MGSFCRSVAYFALLFLLILDLTVRFSQELSFTEQLREISQISFPQSLSFEPSEAGSTFPPTLPEEGELETATTESATPPRFCVDWDTNADEWWTHHPDWDVVEESDDGICFEKLPGNPKTAFLLQMYANQHRNDCSQVYTRYMWSSGWGADLNNVKDGIRTALETNRPLAMTNNANHPWWHYAAMKKDGSNPTCPNRDLSCYFLNLTSCEPSKKPNEIQANGGGEYFGDERSIWIQEYVTRPQQWLRKAIYDYMKEKAPHMEDHCSVIHVRRADVVLHGVYSRKYIPVADYVQALPEHRRRPGSSILLLTDDANAIDEAHEFFPHIDWKYLNRTRFRGAEGGWENQTPSNSPLTEVIQILAIFRLVQKCDAFVFGRSNLAIAIKDLIRSIHTRPFCHELMNITGGQNASAADLDVRLEALRKELQKPNGE